MVYKLADIFQKPATVDIYQILRSLVTIHPNRMLPRNGNRLILKLELESREFTSLSEMGSSVSSSVSIVKKATEFEIHCSSSLFSKKPLKWAFLKIKWKTKWKQFSLGKKVTSWTLRALARKKPKNFKCFSFCTKL